MTDKAIRLERQASTPDARRILDRWLRSALHARLRRLSQGCLTLVDGRHEQVFGDPRDALRATIRVRDARRFYGALARHGALGAAESYMDGAWRCDDLTAVIRILARNREALRGLDRGPAALARPLLRGLHSLRRNTRAGSRRNIAAHYDLGDDFFSLFLDPTLTYSCAIFEREGMTLEEASVAKYERVCRKLDLSPADHVLEIGTGWGGFAVHAASRHGCRVTSATISEKQCRTARRRVEEAGLAERVEVVRRDYRELTGTYDKLVSIEMIEAVGHAYLETFFRVCSERLRPEGSMLLQAITVRDQDLRNSLRSVDFIKRYVFPGGQLVSLGAIGDALAAGTDLRITHLEDIGPHYAETLARWRGRMQSNLDRMRALGLGERFLAMWEYYLCYCEGGFRERAISAAQILLHKPLCRREPVLGTLAAA